MIRSICKFFMNFQWFQAEPNWHLFDSLSGDSSDKGNIDNDDDNGNNNGSIVNDSLLVAELIDKDEVELEDDDVNNLSNEEECDRYTSRSCRKSLAKVGPSLCLLVKQSFT